MCGINGFNWEDEKAIALMNDCLHHRGPDDEGIFTDQHVSLGHRRLSIQDLTQKGRQPMLYEYNGRKLFIVFNGEIYNFKELRKKLEKKYTFKSNTDTEVILASYLEWGQDCVSHFNGMWAFSIYDINKKILFCSRDRIGIKPFYYYFEKGKFIFSSEMKGIHIKKKTVDPETICDIFKFRVILGNKTLFKEIKKLQPGENLIFDLRNKKLKLEKYWEIQHDKSRWITDEQQLKKKVREILTSSVDYRLIADVPIGVSLSGGLDSSLLTAIIKKKKKDITAYTVGFGIEGDENREAKETAKHLGIQHKNIFVSVDEIREKLDDMVDHLEEGAPDPAIIPAYFIYREIAKDVKVLILGDGSDELFGGYDEYKVFSLPVLNFIKKKMFVYLRKPFKQKLPIKNCISELSYSGDLNDFMLTDLKNILPNFMLLRVDKLSMAYGLETRVPFLDHRLVELAYQIPPKFKLRKFIGKYILRQMAEDYLPAFVLKRRKRTFFSPLDVIEPVLIEDASLWLQEGRLDHILDYDYFSRLIDIYQHKFSKHPLAA